MMHVARLHFTKNSWQGQNIDVIYLRFLPSWSEVDVSRSIYKANVRFERSKVTSMAKIESDIVIADKARMAKKLNEYAESPRSTTADRM